MRVLRGRSPCQITTKEWSWGALLGRAWKRLPSRSRASLGLNFDVAKQLPLSNDACVAAAREALAPTVENPEWLMTYSWRRVIPTLAHMCKLPAQDMLALGDWQGKRAAESAGPVASIALRYSDNTQLAAIAIKHRMHLVFAEVSTHDTWTDLPEGLPQRCCGASGTDRSVDTAMDDRDILWRAPVVPGPTIRRFRLKASQVAPPKLSMPDIPGRVLLTHTKGGARICDLFQTGECQEGKPGPQGIMCLRGVHRCAVEGRSGRVCGGTSHGASTCNARHKKAKRERSPELPAGFPERPPGMPPMMPPTIDLPIQTDSPPAKRQKGGSTATITITGASGVAGSGVHPSL